MNYKGLYSFVLFFVFTSGICFAGDNESSHKAEIVIPQVALLAIQYEGSAGIQFSATGSNAAGDQVELKSLNTKSVWLNYSSVVAKNQKRKVTATVVGNIPEGVILKVDAQENFSQSKGDLGKSNRTVTLSNSPSDIVSGIGSCYTGKGTYTGHRLSYELEIESDQFYKSKQLEDVSLSIVYTLTDDN